MKNSFFIFSLLIVCFHCPLFAQDFKDEEILHIYDKEGFVNSDIEGQFHYLISLKSRDSLFERDGYKFLIPNKISINEFVGLQEIGKEVSLDSLRYIRKSDLGKFSNCELHDFLSLKEKIYVILKSETTYNNRNRRDDSYWRYPLIYMGTQKNIEMMKNH